MARLEVVDSHVHFWDPRALEYPWLSTVSPLLRPYLPPDFTAATGTLPVGAAVFVEANPRPDLAFEEVLLAESFPLVSGIVAYAGLDDTSTLMARLDALSARARVKGIRQNIQGHPAGYCLQPWFLEGVREAGRRGFSFDLCATQDQLLEVAELCRRCAGTRLVLDHCGKPAIRPGAFEPWASAIAEIAVMDHVSCKISGLATQADPAAWDEEDLLPYALHVVETFGPARVLYGSDWPVLTLAGDYARWYQFTRRLSRSWSAAQQRAFFRDNAVSFYRL